MARPREENWSVSYYNFYLLMNEVCFSRFAEILSIASGLFMYANTYLQNNTQNLFWWYFFHRERTKLKHHSPTNKGQREVEESCYWPMLHRGLIKE